MTNNYLDDIDEKFILEIHPTDSDDPLVKAHLPEEFGFGVGSKIEEPFSKYLSGGPASMLLATQEGASLGAGLFTKRYWMGPEKTDISLNLNFYSHYNAATEVVDPIQALMRIAVSGNNSEADKIENLIPDGIPIVSSALEKASAAGLFQYATQSEPVTVHFGNIFTIERAFISEATSSFSNVLDNQGYPISGSISLTLVVVDPYYKGTITKAFG